MMTMPAHSRLHRSVQPSQQMWRYMPLAALLSLLQTGELYFPSTKRLMEMDPWEGALNVEKWENT
jgi:hypothetical protein